MKFSAVLGLVLAFSVSAGAQTADLKSLSTIRLNARLVDDIAVMTKSCGLALTTSGVEGILALVPVVPVAERAAATHWQFSDGSNYAQVMDQRSGDTRQTNGKVAGAVVGGAVAAIIDGGLESLGQHESDISQGAFAVAIGTYDGWVLSKDSKCGQAYSDFQAVSNEKASRSPREAALFRSVKADLTSKVHLF